MPRPRLALLHVVHAVQDQGLAHASINLLSVPMPDVGFVHTWGHCLPDRQNMAQRTEVNGRTSGLDSSAATTGAHRVSYMSICVAQDHHRPVCWEPRCCVYGQRTGHDDHYLRAEAVIGMCSTQGLSYNEPE